MWYVSRKVIYVEKISIVRIFIRYMSKTSRDHFFSFTFEIFSFINFNRHRAIVIDSLKSHKDIR